MTAQLTPTTADEPSVAPGHDALVAAPDPHRDARVARCPVSSAAPATGAGWEVAPPVDPREAEDFLRQHHAEGDLPDVESRVAQVQADVDVTGTYTHTAAEIAFATRVAWRNAAKCVGRLPWSKLVVRDRRHLVSGAEVAQDCLAHLCEAWNGGGVLPTISVYAAARPGEVGPRLWNPQLIRYAGHRRPDGTVLGDPANAELTAHLVAEHGWQGAGTAFDVLPLLVTGAGEAEPHVLELPPEVVQEVEISHPEHTAITDMGLRWHALPVIADQRLEAGGLWYTCAPFSGWYLADEVGARNFSDTDRYDLLPEVARRLGLDTSGANPYWRDTAQLELTRAVHHSYKQAGVTVTDHHTEDKRMMIFARGSQRRGHRLEVEWGWVTPPFGASLTRAWHELYDGPRPDADLRPAYVRQEPPAALAPRPRVVRQRDAEHDADG